MQPAACPGRVLEHGHLRQPLGRPRIPNLDSHSAPYIPASTTTHTTPVPNGRTYTVQTFRNQAGVVVAQKYTIDGMNHAWSGGPPVWPFSDELGPDATGISWNFFRNYHR